MKNIVKINSKIKKFKRTIEVPGDKSISIRWVMLASIAVGRSTASNLLESDDVESAINGMKKLGVRITKINNKYNIYGSGLGGLRIKKNTIINAGNSGTFARLFCGIVSSYNKSIKLIGDKSLSKRDFSRIMKPLSLFGVNIKSNNNKLPLIITGTDFMRPIYYIEKKGSAQVKSTILFAALNSPGKTIIDCAKSRNHTEIMLKKSLNLPIRIKKQKKYDRLEIIGEKNFKSFNYKIPGDISSAAFFIVLTTLSENSKLLIRNVNINKTRTGIIDVLKMMNGKIKIENKNIYRGELIGDIFVKSTKNLKSINCPKSINSRAIDEFLIIFLLCAKAKGISKFDGLEELRQKESDRLKIAYKFLKIIGIKTEVNFNSIKIYGNPKLNLKGNYKIKSFLKDHRVFMMSCIAALTFGGNFEIHDRSSINSSFPTFINILEKIGAKII